MAKKRDVYIMSNGQPVTEGSVSALCGIIDKSEKLVPWAAKKVVEAVAGYWKPGVSYERQYIELALMDAKSAHRKAKDTAADFGTRIHLIVGMYIDGQLKPADVANEQERRALENFIKATAGWEWFGSEVVVVNEWCECGNGQSCGNLATCPTLRGYGGTTDGFARLPSGMYVIPDVKTSNSVQASYSMQCALYAAAKPIGECAHLQPLWEKIEEARILHFDKELLTWEVLERNIKEQFPFIHPFIQCWRWKKRFDQRSYSTYGEKKVEVSDAAIAVPSSASAPLPASRPPQEVWVG